MNNKLKILSLFISLFLIFTVFTFAQDEKQVFIINSFNFNIKGMTRPFAIIRNAELKTGEIFEGEEKLNKYISEKTQILLNQRVLRKVEVEYSIGEEQPDGKYPVDLLFNIEDTWNIIVLPQPKYDSNTGFELILKARDYNFLGTMNPLRLDIGYKYDQYENSSLLVDIESDTPFTLFGFNWNLTFNHYFSYRPEVSEPFYYKNETGLSMQLPYKKTIFTFGFSEFVVLNEENEDRYVPDWGKFQHGVYMSSKLFTSWKIPTGLFIGDNGELTYKPEISFTFNHEFPKWPLADFRHGPLMRLYHTFGFNKIDWIGNYRKGLDVSLSNTYSYNFYQIDENIKGLNISYSISGKGHFILSDFFGISAYLQFRHWFYHDPNYNNNAGDVLRGIMNNQIYADYMLSLNLDFPVKILDFVPSQWFNTKKLRYFDFEMHVSPIIDLALRHDPENKIPFNFKNMLVSGGIECIVFPSFFRSLYLRISIAWNIIEQINNPNDYYLNPILPVLPHLPKGENREIFIGIGHHY